MLHQIKRQYQLKHINQVVKLLINKSFFPEEKTAEDEIKEPIRLPGEQKNVNSNIIREKNEHNHLLKSSIKEDTYNMDEGLCVTDSSSLQSPILNRYSRSNQTFREMIRRRYITQKGVYPKSQGKIRATHQETITVRCLKCGHINRVSISNATDHIYCSICNTLLR